MKKNILSFYILIFSATCFAKSDFQKIQLAIEGEKREALLFDPRANKSEPRPLLIMFHGAGGTAEGNEKLTNMKQFAKSKNFLLLHPQGLKKNWNDGRNEKAKEHKDLEFFDGLVHEMKSLYKVDEKRIYVAGMSNGGLFSFRLACERSKVIQAIATVTANIGENLSKTCKPEKAISIIMMGGTDDPLMPFKGGEITGPFGLKKLGKVLSFDDSFKYWAKQFKCPEPLHVVTTDADSKDGTSLEAKTYSNCSEGQMVTGLIFHGAGHTWPSGWSDLRESIIGKTSQEISASAKIVEFFKL